MFVCAFNNPTAKRDGGVGGGESYQQERKIAHSMGKVLALRSLGSDQRDARGNEGGRDFDIRQGWADCFNARRTANLKVDEITMAFNRHPDTIDV